MSQELQTRAEHSRSIADAEHFKALDDLKDIGLFIPVEQVDSFHGRVGKTETETAWQVDPAFANGSNDSGNHNVNSRPSLYTGEHQIAEDFTKQRMVELVRPAYQNYFADRVAALDDTEESAATLQVINEASRRLWERQSQDARTAQKSTPTVFTLENITSRPAARKAANLLEQGMSAEEKQEVWDEIAAQYRGEVHAIVADDPDAVVIDLAFDSNGLNEVDKKKYKDALEKLLIPITEGSPLDFEDRHVTKAFVDAMRDTKLTWVSSGNVSVLAEKSGIREATALQLASAWNTRWLARSSPAFLAKKMIESTDDITTVQIPDSDGSLQELPINIEYVQRYFQLNHVVGIKQSVDSATLGRSIETTSYFDLERVFTENGLEEKKRIIGDSLGSIATTAGSLLEVETNPEHRLTRLLENPYAKPEDLLAAAAEVGDFKKLFDAQTGNWEGFTLAEHTETVLRNFDETYADHIPVQLLGIMRLAILAHDLGKPIAAQERDLSNQKKYNAEQAEKFYTELGIEPQLKALLAAANGDGAQLAYMVDIRKRGDSVKEALQQFAQKTLEDVYGTPNVTPKQVEGFIEICSMLQICDGGAYTNMAITRTDKGGRYRNSPSFNSSFTKPTDLGRRVVKLR